MSELNELFKDQFDAFTHDNVLGYELIDDSRITHYFNGDPICDDDEILVAFMQTDATEKEVTLQIIILNESHFDQFEPAGVPSIVLGGDFDTVQDDDFDFEDDEPLPNTICRTVPVIRRKE